MAGMTLTEFLLARIAEDELDLPHPEQADQCWNEPSRYRAECEAKRRIVELHVVGDPAEWASDQWACRLCQWDEDCDSPKHDRQYGAGRFPCDTLRALALPYADHEDFKEAWKP